MDRFFDGKGREVEERAKSVYLRLLTYTELASEIERALREGVKVKG